MNSSTEKIKQVNDQLKTIKRLSDSNAELANDLADVWNTLLDYRVTLVKDALGGEESLACFGFKDDVVRLLKGRMQCWVMESIVTSNVHDTNANANT